MISQEDKDKIIKLAEKYKVTRILLFGSCSDDKKESRDIDLAVEGLEDSKFFKFYGELILTLSKPVDLIDLDKDSGFTRMVGAEGVPVYG